MIEDNYKAAARLIATTEEQTKLPVRIDWDDQLTFGAILRLSEDAKNANDTYELPTPDKVTSATSYTKHCFWLNASYVKYIIYKSIT